jgi:hypothetical protein
MAPSKPRSTGPATPEPVEKPEVERKRLPVAADRVKVGDLMVFPYWGRVKEVQRQGEKVIVDSVDPGLGEFYIEGRRMIEGGGSADMVHEEEKVSRTRAAELLISSYNRPFTVCFTKQSGEPRTLRGRLVAAEPLLGRSHVEDLDLAEGDRIRLVDHRTLKWLIVDGVKYLVK